MLQGKCIKTYIREEDDDCCKVIQLFALSNGMFVIDFVDVTLWPEGWSCDGESDHSVRFDNFLSADKHLEFIAGGLYESSIHDPAESVNDMFAEEAAQNFKFEVEYRKKEHAAKQAEYDKINKFEATCKKTGERMVFTADTEKKALKLAEIYFPSGVLKMEKVNVKVKPDEWY